MFIFFIFLIFQKNIPKSSKIIPSFVTEDAAGTVLSTFQKTGTLSPEYCSEKDCGNNYQESLRTPVGGPGGRAEDQMKAAPGESDGTLPSGGEGREEAPLFGLFQPLQEAAQGVKHTFQFKADPWRSSQSRGRNKSPDT